MCVMFTLLFLHVYPSLHIAEGAVRSLIGTTIVGMSAPVSRSLLL